MNTFIIVAESGKWIKKDAGISRWISEKVFPSYREQMENLRTIDEQIREWTQDLDSIVKQAKASLNKGNALDVVYWLSDINKRLKMAIKAGKGVSDLQATQLEELFGGHEQELQENYFSEPLTSTAGILDDVKERVGRWRIEKLYKAQLEKRRLALQGLLRLAEATVMRVNSSLKDMAKARNEGNIKKYLEILNQISSAQLKFETQFKKIYEENFKELGQRMLVRKREEEKARQETAKKKEEEVAQTAVAPTQPMTTVSPMALSPVEIPDLLPKTVPGKPVSEEPFSVPEEAIETTPPKAILPQLMELPSLPEMIGTEGVKEEELEEALKGAKPKAKEKKEEKKQKKKDEETPETKRSVIAQALLNVEHYKFYQELEKAALSNRPHLIGAMLLKYSEMIEDKDFEKSMQLLSLAEGLLE